LLGPLRFLNRVLVVFILHQVSEDLRLLLLGSDVTVLKLVVEGLIARIDLDAAVSFQRLRVLTNVPVDENHLVLSVLVNLNLLVVLLGNK
jgi:hypothetical protein